MEKQILNQMIELTEINNELINQIKFFRDDIKEFNEVIKGLKFRISELENALDRN